MGFWGDEMAIRGKRVPVTLERYFEGVEPAQAPS